MGGGEGGPGDPSGQSCDRGHGLAFLNKTVNTDSTSLWQVSKRSLTNPGLSANEIIIPHVA